MTELTSLRNIGKVIEKELKSVDICSAEVLKQMGSKEAFLRLKIRYPDICLMHLYALQGAVDDVEYHRLSEEMKHDLKMFRDGLK